MRIISINVNGIQRAADNGLFEWLAEQNVDVISATSSSLAYPSRSADNAANGLFNLDGAPVECASS